jgi:hypothetical protein
MSIVSTTERPNAIQHGRLGVPWKTVGLLGAVMAYADVFWLTSLRNSVGGATERVQAPFASWWQESTLVLPVFVFAVLGAVMLAMHWFGPVVRKPRPVTVTGLLIVAAGTVAGVAATAASSAYDYHLGVVQGPMKSMRGVCTGSCLEQQHHEMFALHVRGVVYISGWILLTNLVLVAWLVAMWGGRLKLSTTRGQHDSPTDTDRPTGSTRVNDMRLLLVATLVTTAAIHAALVPGHLSDWTAAGLFFMVLTIWELAVAGMLLARLEERIALPAAAVISLGSLAVWLYSRTAGLSFGPDAGAAEGVSLSDALVGALEVVSLIVAVVLLRAQGWLGRRPPASAHVRGLILVALIAVTAIGLAGTGLSWFDVFGISGSHGVMETDMSH